jgi:hypothetical protein
MNQIDLGAGALWSLIVVSVLAGVAMVYVFRRWSDQDALRGTANRMLAHLMEFRLFIDEPALVMRAQRDLFVENWRLLRLLARPSLILVLPSIVLLAQMDACYGRAPLRIGDPAVVTVQVKHLGRADAGGIVLKTPAAIRVETPGVRIMRLNQISWRIRPVASASGELKVVGPERVVTKSIVAGQGLHYLSGRRSVPEFFLHLSEPPLIDSSIASIEVLYPSATILRLHWLVWFLLVSSGTAMVVYGSPGVFRRIGFREK